MQKSPKISLSLLGCSFVVAAVAVMTVWGKVTASAMKSEFSSLYTFTEMALKNAREMARAGDKDAARGWWRYFHNSGVITVLNDYSGASQAEISTLKAGLSALYDECNPATRCDQKTEMAEIRIRLDGLAFGISKLMETRR